MNNRISMFLLGATLALGFTMAAYLLSGAIRSVRNEAGIRVKGFAEIPVTSDLVTWRLAINARDPDMKIAYGRVADDLKVVLAKLREAGVPESDIRVDTAAVNEERSLTEKGMRTNTIEFYQAMQPIVINSNQVSLVVAAQKQVVDLIRSGITIDSYAPQFTFSKLEELKLELLGNASKNAFERAQIMVSKSGGHIGPIRSASQGVFQIVARNSTDISDGGTYDTSTIEKTVKAVVTLEYETRR